LLIDESLPFELHWTRAANDQRPITRLFDILRAGQRGAARWNGAEPLGSVPIDRVDPLLVTCALEHSVMCARRRAARWAPSVALWPATADRVAAMSSRADSLGARELLAGDGRERVAKARTGGDTQLWKGSVEVTADGPVRQEKPFRNLLVRQA
jgi:hypothetical protein